MDHGLRRYEMRTTNISEVFNGVLKGARNLPITACVEMIFYHVVYYFKSRRELAETGLATNWSFPPEIVKILLHS